MAMKQWHKKDGWNGDKTIKKWFMANLACVDGGFSVGMLCCFRSGASRKKGGYTSQFEVLLAAILAYFEWSTARLTEVCYWLRSNKRPIKWQSISLQSPKGKLVRSWGNESNLARYKNAPLHSSIRFCLKEILERHFLREIDPKI